MKSSILFYSKIGEADERHIYPYHQVRIVGVAKFLQALKNKVF